MKAIIDKLYAASELHKDELMYLVKNLNQDDTEYLFEKAAQKKEEQYGKAVYMRGLIEFTNYCVRNCLYCGIRSDNKYCDRYRLSIDEIIEVSKKGYELGFRTFVLQGGEDSYYDDEKIVSIIKGIKERFPDCAVTLSIGEKSRKSYQKYFEAGADRCLLRHETASKELYNKLHPKSSFENRIRCLYDLKEIGYQVGAGFMVGLPGQTSNDLTEDLVFLKKLEPQMVGIGPFIPQKDTPLGHEKGGTSDKTLIMLALVRLLLPESLIPATTALGTIDPKGREKALKTGANVVMPNLTPVAFRSKYSLYDGKICTGEEASECLQCISNRIRASGFDPDMSRGDHKNWRINSKV